jgi:hypothetical protein
MARGPDNRVSNWCRNCNAAQRPRGGRGYQGEEPPPATLPDLIQKYRTLRDRLWERQEREGADFGLLPQAQLKWASSVLMDLERVEGL